MKLDPDDYRGVLASAHDLAIKWIESVPDRPVAPRADVDEMVAAFDGPVPDGPSDPDTVVRELAALAEPGLMAIPSGRFFGWVMGGTLPASLGADWLVSAWDQNTGLRYATPATAAIEQVAGSWLLQLLGLPVAADVGFTTGATMANWTGLAAGRVRYSTELAGMSTPAGCKGRRP